MFESLFNQWLQTLFSKWFDHNLHNTHSHCTEQQPTYTHITRIKLIVLLQLQLKNIIDTVAYYNHFVDLKSNLVRNDLIDIAIQHQFAGDIIIMSIIPINELYFTYFQINWQTIDITEWHLFTKLSYNSKVKGVVHFYIVCRLCANGSYPII